MSDNETAAVSTTDFKHHFQELQHQWKIALKRNKKCLLKCPNYNQCQFKCGSIGGMTYHYTRCSGTRPQFRCEVCGKEYESRTGLNYHNSGTHHDLIAQKAKAGAAHKEVAADSNTSRPLVRSPQPSSPLSPTVKKRGRRGRPRKTQVTFGAGHGSDPASTPPPSSEGSPPPDKSNLPLKKVTITIPSIEYPEKYRSYLPVWRDELKMNEFVICPNYSQCQFKCTTVNGMKYHFTRCQKDQLPVFQCQLCTRTFHCRSGLVWHLKNTHRLSDLPPNQKTIQVVVSKGAATTPTSESEPAAEGKVKRRRGRPPRVPIIERGRSIRKSLYPRRTAADILHQLLQAERMEGWRDDHFTMVPVSPPPTPRLHPCSTPSPVPPTEFIITDDIPTDTNEHSSFIVDYPEELLTSWHRWYSSDESDGEEDWREHLPWSTHSPVQSAPLASLSDHSSSSASDDSSDEDYSFSKVSKKVGKGRGRGKKMDKEGAAVRRVPGVQPVKIVTPQPPPLRPVTDSVAPIPKVPPLLSSLPRTTKDLSPAKKVQEPRPPPTTHVKREVKVAPRPVSHTPVTTATGVVQYYPIQVQNVPNLVPMQLVGSGAQAVQSNNVSYQMAQTQSGKLVLLPQSGTQSPQYAIQSSSSGTPQRVSVIMNPGAVVYTTQGHTSSARGYITQLDGPPGGTRKRKGKTKQSKEELKKKFEAARSAERQHKPPSPTTSAQSHDILDSPAKLPENLMSAQLKSYLSRSEQQQQIRSRTSNSPSSPKLTSPTKQHSNQSILAISPTLFDFSETSTTAITTASPENQTTTTTTSNEKELSITSSTTSQSLSDISSTQPTEPLAAASGSSRGKNSSAAGKVRKTVPPSKRTRKASVSGEKGKRARMEEDLTDTQQHDEQHGTVNDEQQPQQDAGEEMDQSAITATPSATDTAVKKKRGRPRKASQQDAGGEIDQSAITATAPSATDTTVKKRQGRPRKASNEPQQDAGGEIDQSAITATAPSATDTTVKKRQGRPRKASNEPQQDAGGEIDQSAITATAPSATDTTVKKRQGRPRKASNEQQPQQDAGGEIDQSAITATAPSATDTTIKKRQGRPRKASNEQQPQQDEIDQSAITAAAHSSTTDTTVKKKRGRPGKAPSMVQITGNHMCELCNVGLSSRATLKKHKETTHFPVPDDAPLSDRKSLWRKAIKKHKLVACDRCLTYQAVSVPSMAYHYERCGREAVQEVCKHCGKTYTTKPGLQYHIRVCHTESKEDAVMPSLEVEVSPGGTPGVRKAAKSATSKMRELEYGKDGESGAKKRVVLEDEVGLVSSEELLRLKEHLLQHSSVQCPQEECTQEFKSYFGLLYHLKNKQTYSCPQCGRVLTKKRLLNHIRSRHPELEIDAMDDLEFTPVSVPVEEMEQDEGGGEEEEEEGAELMAEVEELSAVAATAVEQTVTEQQKPKLNIPMRSVFGKGGSQQAVLKLLSMLTGNNSDMLFPKWIPKISHFRQVPVSEHEEYLAVSQNSIAVSTGDQSDSITLPLHSASSLCDGSNDVLMNTGGSVWSMDWAPVHPSCDQYLALAAYRQPHETYRIDSPLAHKGLIQLWNVGNLSNTPEMYPTAFFSLGIAHNYGVIRDMQWCPSGCWEDGKTSSTSSCWADGETTPTDTDGELHRLGLLAVACSDGKLRILSIPHPQCCTSGHPLITPADIVTPVHVPATLIPGGCGDNAHYGQCLCVAWLPGNGHRKIAAGFSNGSVVVWDLLSSLPFQFDHSRGVVYSQTVLMAHSGPCRCVVWCPSDHYFLFTGGHDRRGCLWDLRQPHTPVEQFERNWLTEAHWPLLWSGVHVLEEPGLSKKYGPLYLSFNSQTCCPGRVYTSTGPIMSCSYSNWSTQLATGSLLGELHLTSTNCSFYSTLRSKTACSKNKMLFWCSLEKTSEEDEDNDSQKLVFNKSQIPKTLQYSVDCSATTAITKVLWHPSQHCHQWLLVALSCGLVRLVHTT